MMAVMNHLGYQAMVPGNHEFDFGLENMERARKEADFPWIAANIRTPRAAPVKPFEPYRLLNLAGVRIALVGVTTPAVERWKRPEDLAGIRFLDGVRAAAEAVAELQRRHRPDLIIVAVHAGLGPVPPGPRGAARERGSEDMAYRIAAEVRGIDAVVYGHSHRRESGLRAGDAVLVQPQHRGASVARIDFRMERGSGRWKRTAVQSRLLPVRAATPADPHVVQIAARYHELTENYLNLQVAAAGADLDARFASIRDSALIDAVHAVQLHYTGADVSFTAVFQPELRIVRGPVTVRRLAALYPFDNDLCLIEGTGQMVKDALENSARYFLQCRTPACGQGPLRNRAIAAHNYDTAQGVSYEIDLRRPAGDRVRNLRWQGKPLDPHSRLRIALNSHRAAGGAGYAVFRSARILWRSSEDLRSLIVRYYAPQGRLPASPDNNWRLFPEAAIPLLEAELAGKR